MEKLSLRQRSVVDLTTRVKTFKKTIKQWFYYAGLKYLKTHKLTEPQETFLEDITDFFVEYMDNVENDKDFLKRAELEPINLPIKKN